METKNMESQIEKFVKGVDSLGNDLLEEGKGYMLLAYEEMDNDSQKNTFSFRGKLNRVAECLYSCMKSNEVLANIIIAAANALVQNRMLEAKMKAEASEKKKARKNKKVN